MKTLFNFRRVITALWLTLLLALPTSVQALSPNPDLTAAGAIAALKADTAASPVYGLTYNLGATGLRGWIYIGGGYGADGTITTSSRQILVTVASAPGSAVLAVNDVILGAMAGSSGTVPLFTSDSRKAFGAAIGEAEKTGAGTLRLKRWRAGTAADVNISMTIMGDYTATAPYSCPKSALVLANARNKLVSQLLADPNFVSYGWVGAINGLALLASVAPGYVHPTQPTATYAYVQSRLQTAARSVASKGPQRWGLDIWDWGYNNLFLAEYYLRTVADGTPDASVVAGLNNFTLTLAQSQSMYGTFGHNPSVPRPDGSGRLSVIGYGPVNQAGIPANIGIVMGKKALVAAGQMIDPQIDSAIQHGSDFFAWYVNKGSIPYGEHLPGAGNHASNGKDAECAVLFGVQANRLTETEYFSRMTTAGFTGREYGHTGQGFSYLWGAMGANMGGALAVAEYLKPVRWHLDLERRTDGSFVYDGQEQYGAGATADGTYLGASDYDGLNPTASYILTYGLPLQRLSITGKNANAANTLDSTKVADAIAAATFNLDCHGLTTTQLIADLSAFDPMVRNYAAIELATRSLSPTELTTLRTMISGTDANGRQGACQTLGLLKDPTALLLITQRLDKTIEPDSWVRATAASALRMYDTATASTQLTPMLTAFAANATDPDVIVWNDPLQAGNSYLSMALFGDTIYGGNDISTDTINAAKSLLYPAVKAGLKQPDSYPLQGASDFAYGKLTFADVQAMPLEIINNVQYECQVDRMWSPSSRAKAIMTLGKHHFAEGIPLALAMLEVPAGFGYGSDGYLIPALNVLAGYGDAARWTLPALRGYLAIWDPLSAQYATLVTTIATLEAAITSPAGITNLKAAANPQLVVTTGAKAITLTGSSCRDASVSFSNVTAPTHGTLTGAAPNLTYTPTAGYTGPDRFTFQTADTLTTSEPATVSIIVGTAGAGLKGEYFDNANFTNLKLTRTDTQVNFDWGTGSPNALIGADTFSVRWSGMLLVPETGTYTFSTLNSDGVRLYIDGALVLDDYVDQSTTWKDGISINLTAGQMVDLQLEYYENTGSAVAKLKWTGPSFAGANGAVIPKEWLFDGTGVTRTPYAHAQSVTLVQNLPQALTLTGSGGTLTYAVITPPAHGSLAGIAPNLTYTPAANYSGSDSFTFLVNNGTSNSTPATVSISVWAGQGLTYTWGNPVSGNWSVASNWTSGTAPAATGQPSYNLDFAPAGTYTVTHDLNNGLQLNQLNLAGAVTLAGTNSLTFTANGTILPQLNQNSASAVTINTPLNLAAMTTFGGSGGGKVTLSSLISGSGGLTKNSSGILTINNFNNTYSGGTVLNAGKVNFPPSDTVTPFFGTGPVTINPNATIEVNRTYLTNPITLNGTAVTGGNSFGSTLGGPVTLTGITTFDFGTTGGFAITGNVSGTGGLTTVGTTQWTLSGASSFTGPTTIQAGAILYTAAASVAPGALVIGTGGKANLSYSGNAQIASLVLGGTAMLPDTYGSTSSSARVKNDTYFSGTGMVSILPASTTALALTGGSTPSNLGASLTFTATVSGGSPTGNVAFYDGTTLLGTSTLNGSYQASVTTSGLTIGAHSITARYAGNATIAASTSAAVVIEVVSLLPFAPTNLLAVPGFNHVGLSWTLSAGATGYHVWRSLTSGGPYTVIGSPSSGGYDDPTAANGTTYYYVVSATNASGESANSSQVSATPGAQTSITTLTSSPFASGPYGAAVTFTATVSVLGAPASGTVTFKEGSTVLASGTLSGGLATFTTSTLAVANHVLTATYGGDATTTASVSAPYAYAVTVKGLTLIGVTAADKVYDGNTTAVLAGGALSGVIAGETVTVVAGAGTFARFNVGNWAVTATGYSLGGPNAGNYVLAAQPAVPNATIRLSGTPAPTTTRTFNLGPQDGGTTIQVAKGPGSMQNLIPWITPGMLPPCSVLRSVSATVRLDSATSDSWTSDLLVYVDVNPAAAGTGAFMQIGGDYSGKVGTVAQKLSWGMGNGGPGTTITTTKTAGVDWSGDIDLNAFQLSLGNNYATATWSGTITIAYDVSGPPAAPTNLLAAPGNNHVDLTWTVAPGATGYRVKRSLTDGGSYTVIANSATAGYTDLTAVNGTTYYYVVSATNVAGESANSNQVSATPTLVPSTTTLVSSPVATGPYGAAVTLTATVAVSGGPATGTVTFKDGGTVLGSGTLSAGTASFATSTLAVADHSLTATYVGDTTFAGSVSVPYAYLVTAKPLTITGVTASDKVYDGTANATLTTGTLSSGVIAGETVTVVPGSGTFASANAGTWAVTTTGFGLGGPQAGNYMLAAQPTVANATIAPRPVQLGGTRLYDGTPATGALSVFNNVDGVNLGLTGSTSLAGKNVGAQAVVMNLAAATLVRSAKGNTGANAATTIGVAMGTAPVAGNTMIAVIATRGTSANIVSSITQAGVPNGTWVRASQANNTSMTTEIWYAPNVPSGAGTAVTINQTSARSAAVVMEYSGVLAGSPLDQIAPGNSVGTSNTAATGTIAATTQANELWLGSIGFASSSRTLGSLVNGFTAVDNAASTHTTAGNNARVYALQRIVSSAAAAFSGGTISASQQWAGTIATFKTVTPTTLALTGSAAANYTLTGATGVVQITPKALTPSGLSAVGRTYDGTTVAALSGTAALLPAEAPGTGTTSDGKPYTGDTLALSGTAAGAFADPSAGPAKAVTVTGLTLSGAASGNYALTQPTGLTAPITAKPLTVTADNQTKTYGQTLAFGSGATQFTSSGLQAGETIGSVTMTCAGGNAATPVASYPITPGAATGGTFGADNYSIGYMPGTLTVNPADQTITFGPLADRTDGDAPFVLTATASSGLTVSYLSSDPTVARVDGTTVTILKAGSTTLTASQAGDANHHAALPVAQPLTVKPGVPTDFASWAAAPAQGLTAGVNDAPLDDPDRDGFSNLLEFTLGGEPMVPSQTIQPKLTHAVGGTWAFEYDRSAISKTSTTQVVEFGNDLSGWTPLAIPADSAGGVTITPGATSDHVKVTLPSLGTQVFARLKVWQ